jgi:hypothetical protein
LAEGIAPGFGGEGEDFVAVVGEVEGGDAVHKASGISEVRVGFVAVSDVGFLSLVGLPAEASAQREGQGVVVVCEAFPLSCPGPTRGRERPVTLCLYGTEAPAMPLPSGPTTRP